MYDVDVFRSIKDEIGLCFIGFYCFWGGLDSGIFVEGGYSGVGVDYSYNKYGEICSD